MIENLLQQRKDSMPGSSLTRTTPLEFMLSFDERELIENIFIHLRHVLCLSHSQLEARDSLSFVHFVMFSFFLFMRTGAAST